MPLIIQNACHLESKVYYSTYSYELHPKEYNQNLRYYQFLVNLNRFAGSCNTLGNVSSRVFISNETEDLNFHVFNMITGINKSKILTRYTSCK